ncbi:agmatine coumaroyltransferase-2-like protein [Cinnamomum micranthum f. kanehirae]|uniref:Agmatine coumaroyltransferase-2-like protein n=1 Tax=Cinnamomum micranthum f. kanehirae TaxID=337451 RepID=A0A443Q4P8_9MAGN|nr:agmatine coumaroyltransferase-2-like protein [Cinnamomum micranthum f. kanehirae]
MAIEITNTTTLKPSSSSPPLPPLDTHIPLTVFDRAAFDLHVAIIYSFRPPMPSNQAMIEGLSKALHYFPHLAGRVSLDDQCRPCIILNDAGIRLVEARVDMTISERLPFDPSPELRQLHPSIHCTEELLQIQLNRFSCGGLVIGLTAHHRIADGQSMSSFFLAWARLVRGLDVDPLPYHDRGSISIPRNPPHCEFDHQEIEFREDDSPSLNPTASLSSIENIVVHFSADFINKIKKQVIDNSSGRRYSTFECLLAHLWKKVTIARGLHHEEFTQVRVAVNGRARMKPPVPMEFFGNLVLWAYPRLRVGDLVDGSHAFIAKAIHSAVARIDNAYFQSFIDFGELYRTEEGEEMAATAPDIGNSLCPDMEVDSWLRFQFHDLDFGGGAPCAFLPPNLPVEGLLIFVPSCKEEGGVDVFMSLLPDHADHFKEICHSLE